jgi:hypothetical protein
MSCSYLQIRLHTVNSLRIPMWLSVAMCFLLVGRSSTSSWSSPLIQCVLYVFLPYHILDSTDEEPQVITRAQERLFSGPKQKGVNVITMGYRSVCPFMTQRRVPGLTFSKSYQSGSKMKVGDTRSGVNNFFVNTIITTLQGSDWERLLNRCVLIPFTCLTRLMVCQDRGECYVASTDGNEHICATAQ